MSTTFRNKDGSLTFYALACGYIEVRQLNDRWIRLGYDEPCFYVKVFDEVERRREAWEVFDRLTDARKYFNKTVREHRIKQTIKEIREWNAQT